MKKWIVADCETNPFRHGETVEPFIWAIYDGKKATVFAGETATADFIAYIREFNGLAYAHNGGRFDWMMRDVLAAIEPETELFIINNRIAKAKIGKCELRDSFLILPAPLRAFNKDDFDYDWLLPENREKYSNEIREYIISDVKNLYKPIKRYFDAHGQKLTQAGAAMETWEKMGGEKRRYSETHDEKFRPFYFGGRCEVFKYCDGKKGNWKVYDVNSAYPYAMTFEHWLGETYTTTLDVSNIVAQGFYTIDATSRGALPLRDKKGGVRFPHIRAEFKATGWELLAGLETGTLEIHSGEGLIPTETETLKPYVDRFILDKENAEKRGDKIGRLLAKIFLNSLYGRYAMNPRGYYDYTIAEEMPEPWLPHIIADGGTIWRKPSEKSTFYDVALAASITGNARANLWRAICDSENVVYCDTDSIFCENSGVKIGYKLGEWDCEAEGTNVWIAGKKLYALELNGGEYKTASKGVKASVEDIKRVCGGEVVEVRNDAPTMKLSGEQIFQRRKIKIT